MSLARCTLQLGYGMALARIEYAGRKREALLRGIAVPIRRPDTPDAGAVPVTPPPRPRGPVPAGEEMEDA